MCRLQSCLMTDDVTDQDFSQNAPFVTICHYFLLPSPSGVTVQKVTKSFASHKIYFGTYMVFHIINLIVNELK